MNDDFSRALTIARTSNVLNEVCTHKGLEKEEAGISALFVWAAEVLKRDPRYIQYYADAVNVASNAANVAAIAYVEANKEKKADETFVDAAVESFLSLVEDFESMTTLSGTKKAEELIYLFSHAALQFGDARTQAAQKLVVAFDQKLPKAIKDASLEIVRDLLKRYIAIGYPSSPLGDDHILDSVARKYLPQTLVA